MRKWSLDFGEFEITLREILASVSIIAVMLLIGFVISGKISQNNIDANEKYNKAIKIENDKDMFQYGMETNVGNAFVHGKLKAVDAVTFPEIGGEYMYVKKVEEHYNMHTQTYTTTDSKGHTQTHTRTYWSWDYTGEESKECKEISFCNTKFPSKKIEHPSTSYIKTIKESSHVRFKYYGTGTKFNGTIFAELKDKTIPDNTRFFVNTNIEETMDVLVSDGTFWQILFWIFWIVLTGAAVFGFYYLDNEWLE